MTTSAGSIQSFTEGQIGQNDALTAKRRPAWVEWSFEALAVQHPRATLWPSPPRWEACHLILSRLRLPVNQVPLPPQGAQGLAAKGCTRLRVEMKRKGCPDRQTAACLGECHLRFLPCSTPRATSWPSPPRWEACHLILSRLRLPANQVPLPPQGGAWLETCHQNKSSKKGCEK